MPPSDPVSRWPSTWRHPPGAGTVEGRGAMVVTTDRFASEIGVDVLAAGGNAIDAAVAVAFALAVVNPEAGNVGGSGFLVARTADGETVALDFRGRAPRQATADMFLDAAGETGDRAEVGHLAVAVPGSVRGMWEAHRRLGTRPWSDLIAPAVQLARGFPVTDRLTRSYPPHIVAGLRRFPESERIFLPGGAPPRAGETFSQADLARTLARIRDDGPDGFYRGEVADRIVAEMERGGGVLDHEDLASYEAAWRDPMRIPYREHTLLAMPPSSSGGVTLACMASILAEHRPGALSWHGPEHVHLLAEAWKRAYADRNHYLADTDFADVPVATLASTEYGAWRARSIRAERATPSSEVGPGVEAFGGSHTTHFSIVDPFGNAASVTTTLNTWYGSKLVAAGTGVLLNNEMDDFTTRPGHPNHFGLVQGEANAIEPGKRMLSAMTPTLVLDPAGDLLLVVGTPGGSTIMTTVFQVVSNLVDHGMGLADAVCAPRVHHQHLPDRIDHEPGGLAAATAEALRALGHAVHERDETWGDVQAVLVGRGPPARNHRMRSGDGRLEGFSDPRRGGAALGL